MSKVLSPPPDSTSFFTRPVAARKSADSTQASGGRLAQFIRRLAVALTFACALLLLAWIFRAPLLKGLADAWVINEPVAKADAIVILGGGLENRPFAAAKLFHDGVAPKVLYMDVKLSPAEEIGIVLPESEQTHRLLLSNGVPESAMTKIGAGVASTFDESRAVEAWMKKSGAKSIVIPTDAFHTRRARWIFQRELRDVKADIHVVPVDPRRYTVNDWWQHEEGVIAFQNESIKFIYYWLKY